MRWVEGGVCDDVMMEKTRNYVIVIVYNVLVASLAKGGQFGKWHAASPCTPPITTRNKALISKHHVTVCLLDGVCACVVWGRVT